MKNKLKMNKSKMYQLAKDYSENVPKMINTEFRSYKGSYWLDFRDTENDHHIKIFVDLFLGNIRLMISDLEKRTSKTVPLPEEEIQKRVLI